MLRPIDIALVVVSRFGLLVGLAVWTGVALATLALAPVLFAKLERAQADEVAGALNQRVDRLLLAALVVLAMALVARFILDRAAPPSGLLLPIAAMGASRLVAALVVGPTQRALRTRLRDANAPASDAERAVFGRLQKAWVLLLALEVLLGLFGLYAVK